MIKALVITGYGLNCEAESCRAWELAGASPSRIHLNDLIAKPSQLHDFQILMFIGGFSFGDHMTSGHVFAHRVKHHLQEDVGRFIEEGKLVLGVCNGFQIMTKLGLLPALDGQLFEQSVALTQNDCGHFQNFWVRLRFEAHSPCVFTRNLEFMDLPIRHGEGKLVVSDQKMLQQLEDRGCIPCRYVDAATGEPTQVFPGNPNGSVHAAAGLCDPTGRIFGLMPHPEAFLFSENHPLWDFGNRPDHGDGLRLFKNAVDHLTAAV